MNFVGRAEIIESIQSRIAMNQMSLCVVYIASLANPMWLPACTTS